jgi:1-pyrroline-5-carboxylate dehydrogenase
MNEEIFGPVLSIYVYPDSKVDATLELVGETAPFGLTGAIFAQDEYGFYDKAAKMLFLIFLPSRKFLKSAFEDLKYTAGNFYINDKSTGSVVGQQPFGGGRLSGEYSHIF